MSSSSQASPSKQVCGSELFDESYVMQVFWVCYEVGTIATMSLLMIKWYKQRNTFPILERSPLLSIYFMLLTLVYMVSYPLTLQIDWLRRSSDSLWMKNVLIPAGGAFSYIYLLKSVRLAWGFRRGQRFKKISEWVNRFMRDEWKLIVFSVCGFGLQVGTELVGPRGDNLDLDFVDMTCSEDDSLSLRLILSRLIEGFFGLVYLLVSTYIVKHVDERVNIIYELQTIFLFDFFIVTFRATALFRHFWSAASQISEESTVCIEGRVPLLFLLNWLKLVTTIYVGIKQPLDICNPEHNYSQIFPLNNMHDFLNNFADVFTKFLEHCRDSQRIKNNHESNMLQIGTDNNGLRQPLQQEGQERSYQTIPERSYFSNSDDFLVSFSYEAVTCHWQVLKLLQEHQLVRIQNSNVEITNDSTTCQAQRFKKSLLQYKNKTKDFLDFFSSTDHFREELSNWLDAQHHDTSLNSNIDEQQQQQLQKQQQLEQQMKLLEGGREELSDSSSIGLRGSLDEIERVMFSRIASWSCSKLETCYTQFTKTVCYNEMKMYYTSLNEANFNLLQINLVYNSAITAR